MTLLEVSIEEEEDPEPPENLLFLLSREPLHPKHRQTLLFGLRVENVSKTTDVVEYFNVRRRFHGFRIFSSYQYLYIYIYIYIHADRLRISLIYWFLCFLSLFLSFYRYMMAMPNPTEHTHTLEKIVTVEG